MTYSTFIIPVVVVIGLLPLVWLFGIVAGFWNGKRRHAKHTVIAEYESPSRLTPAELGFIIDRKFGHNELLATLAELNAKKTVRLTALNEKDFSITLLPVSKVIEALLDDIESSVLGYIRDQMQIGQTLQWSQLDTLSGELAGVQADFEAATLASLVRKDLLYPNVFQSLTNRRRLPAAIFAAAACVLLIVFMSHIFKQDTGTSAGFQSVDHQVTTFALLLPTIVFGAVCYLYANYLMFVYYRHAGQPITATLGLQALWPDVAGFQEFLKTTEYVRLQTVHDAKDSSMAYCLALGLDPGFIALLNTKPV